MWKNSQISLDVTSISWRLCKKNNCMANLSFGLPFINNVGRRWSEKLKLENESKSQISKKIEKRVSKKTDS